MKHIKKFFILSLFIFVLVGCKTPTVKVSFVSGTDEAILPISIDKNTSITEKLPTPEKDGYTLNGWYLDEDFSEKYTNQAISSNTTLYAKWTINKYTVKFVDGDVEFASVTVNHGENATPPQNPTKVGHNFTNWDKAYTNVQSNLVINAVFEKLVYTVTFKADDDQIGETQNVNFGESATAPTAPEKTGYDFKGWDKTFNNVTSDLIVNAVYEVKSFTVRFLDYDGFVFKTQKVNYNEAATAPDDPTREGYVFKGWDLDFSNITSNKDVTAEYDEAYFTVTFMYGTTQIDTMQVKYGEGATAPTDLPVITGYEFSAWDKDFSNITTDLTVSAYYTAINYAIKYFDGETELTPNPSSYTIDAEVSLPQSSKSGYYFVGWFLNPNFTDEVVKSIPKGSTGEVTFYGKWLDEALKHNVVYELNGGSWTWTTAAVASPGSGIDQYTNLPEIFMIDFYTYLKDNNLLTSSVVATSLHKTNWTDFSKNYTDPVAIYNHTTTNTSATTNGYSQFFYDTATGDSQTGQILTIEGGFFGTEPYKTKYWHLVNHISMLQFYRAYGTQFWAGPTGKSLGGFIFDGYFYGTQGERTGQFTALRSSIVQPNKGYYFSGTQIQTISTTYPMTNYIQGLPGNLSHPSKEGFVFGGWYETSDFSTPRVYTIPAGQTPAEKYYAKWIAVGDY